MSTPLTPVPTVPPSTYPLIAPGDGVTSANFAQTAQPIINSIAWLQSKVPGANPSGALLDLFIPPEQGLCTAGTPSWTLERGSYRAFWQHTSLSTAITVVFPLGSHLVQGMVLRAFSVDFIGGPAHSALPATKPIVQLVKIARGIGTTVYASSGETVTTLGTATDASASTAAYQLLHTTGMTLGAPETVDLAAFSYHLAVLGESGANSLTGSCFADLRVSVSA